MNVYSSSVKNVESLDTCFIEFKNFGKRQLGILASLDNSLIH